MSPFFLNACLCLYSLTPTQHTHVYVSFHQSHLRCHICHQSSQQCLQLAPLPIRQETCNVFSTGSQSGSVWWGSAPTTHKETSLTTHLFPVSFRHSPTCAPCLFSQTACLESLSQGPFLGKSTLRQHYYGLGFFCLFVCFLFVW